MKHFIFAPLLVFTVWAHSSTYVFWVKINGTLEPLHNPGTDDARDWMAWGNASAMPTEFLYVNGRAHSRNASNPGKIVSSTEFRFEGFQNGSDLSMDKQGKLNGSFYAYFHASGNVKTVYKSRVFPECSPVEVFFLPYNRTTRTPIKSLISENNRVNVSAKREKSSLNRLPHVFFIKTNGTLTPLSHLVWKVLDTPPIHVGFFEYGEHSRPPFEFTIQNNTVFTQNISTPGYVGFYKDQFAFGPIPPAHLKLNTMGKIQDHLYSCRWSGFSSRQIWIIPSHSMVCAEAEIYLLPYNRTSGRPMERPYEQDSYTKPDAGNHTHSIPKVYEQFESHVDKTYSPPPDIPYVFFRRTKKRWIPLSTKFSKHYSKNIFTLLKSKTAPIEFILKDGIAYTNTSSRMFAGVYGENLGYGVSETRTRFYFNHRMRVKNKLFYRCKNGNYSHLIVSNETRTTCRKVRVFLLPYNRTSGLPMIGSYARQ